MLLVLILVSAGEVDHDDWVLPYYLSLPKRYFGNPHDFRFPKSSKPFRSLSLCIENSWKCRMFFFRLKFSQNFRSKTWTAGTNDLVFNFLTRVTVLVTCVSYQAVALELTGLHLPKTFPFYYFRYTLNFFPLWAIVNESSFRQLTNPL